MTAVLFWRAKPAEWFTVAELDGLDTYPTQRRQFRNWLDGTYPHVD